MATAPGTHPVLACARQLESALFDVTDLDPMYMPTRDKASALLTLNRVVASTTALLARVLASADDVADDVGARDAAAWLADEAHLDFHEVRRDLALAKSLERTPLVQAAMAEGRIGPDKARIILRALDGLDDEVTDELRDRAESVLVEHAIELAPKALARVARHLEAVVDPEAADAAEAKALLREERDAWDRTMLRITPRFDGTARISGLIPEGAAHRLRTYLEAYAQPRKLDGEIVRADQRLARAFCNVIELIDPEALPRHGGDATTVMVTVHLEDLRSELGAAALGGVDSDHRISAREARRLACTAEIIPAVLGGASQVLDLGRAQRLFSPAQRKALRMRHSTCQIVGCDVPSAWCDAHHREPWSQGGRTNLGDALLVCGHHHRRLHDPRYAATRTGDRIHLHRRT